MLGIKAIYGLYIVHVEKLPDINKYFMNLMNYTHVT